MRSRVIWGYEPVFLSPKIVGLARKPGYKGQPRQVKGRHRIAVFLHGHHQLPHLLPFTPTTVAMAAEVATLKEVAFELVHNDPVHRYTIAMRVFGLNIPKAIQQRSTKELSREAKWSATGGWECYNGDLDVTSSQAALLAWEHRYNTVCPYPA